MIYNAGLTKNLVSAATKSTLSNGDCRLATKRPQATRGRVLAILLCLLILSGCGALNPLCGSARPAPVLSSLSATTITFSQVQAGFVLTLTGKEFVASSVVIVNGATLITTVQSSVQLQVTIATDVITGPGTATVTVKTPSGNSGNLGCTSGGTSSPLTLTIT